MITHVIIRKEKIKIHTSDEKLALQLRKQVNDMLQYELIAMMERVFVEHGNLREHIHLDKLKVELGTVSAQDFEQHFMELVETQLLKEVRRQLQDHADLPNPSETSIRLATSEKQELAALMFFLEHGHYPWWYQKEQQQTPTQLLVGLSEEIPKKILSTILSIKQDNRNEAVKKIIKRIFIHLPEKKSEQLLHRLSALLNTSVATLVKNKKEILQLFSISEREFNQHVLQFLMYNSIEKKEDILYNFIHQLKKELNFGPTQLEINIVALDDNSSLFADVKRILETEKGTSFPHQEKKEVSVPTKAEEGLYIYNAGLVLLHPFLPTFFAQAALLDEQNNFVSMAAQQKAAVMLYYLQNNQEQYQEWEMPINKIICGMASDEIIPDGIVLTEKEKEEAKVLLETVVQYWEALKGASIEALQSTFLLRNGKISWKQDYWLLHIERTGVDILLDRLPWGISTIKLPWLKALIYTEW